MKRLLSILAVAMTALSLSCCRSPSADVPKGYGWTSHDVPGSMGKVLWNSVVCSSDGLDLLAAVKGGYLYTSTDGGSTWTERASAGSRQWSSLASSADGSILYAVAGSAIFLSMNHGVSWAQRPAGGFGGPSAIACSSNGAKVAVSITYSDYIYTSTDFGSTWTQRTNSGKRGWSGITMSADGQKLAATSGGVVTNGSVYLSANGGQDWIECAATAGRKWTSIAGSGDGAVLAATVYGDFVYVSTDSGSTWSGQSDAADPPSQN